MCIYMHGSVEYMHILVVDLEMCTYTYITFIREIHATEDKKHSFEKKGNMVHRNPIIKNYADCKREPTLMISASHSSWSNLIA